MDLEKGLIFKSFVCKKRRKRYNGNEDNRKTGSLARIGLLTKDEEEDLIVISKKGQTIKTKIKQVPILGRVSQGVRVIKLKKGDKVASAITI